MSHANPVVFKFLQTAVSRSSPRDDDGDGDVAAAVDFATRLAAAEEKRVKPLRKRMEDWILGHISYGEFPHRGADGRKSKFVILPQDISESECLEVINSLDSRISCKRVWYEGSGLEFGGGEYRYVLTLNPPTTADPPSSSSSAYL